ncbi:hypothetical protein C3Y92_03450 [Solidesulfovibrio carbinolicus]|uniref:Uncharacterized protein n=1 Tax=Solidesulfovibrio carbinolicus TaxID=296842 RepID=A0A4P6HML9_9BACT|nr:hypothetical protein C3Y92_03450 [Solidesulfovibrio carbinolicus]
MLSRAGWRQPAFFMGLMVAPTRVTALAAGTRQPWPRRPSHYVFLSNSQNSIGQAYLTMAWGVITR